MKYSPFVWPCIEWKSANYSNSDVMQFSNMHIFAIEVMSFNSSIASE
jgi:hypothetical protein